MHTYILLFICILFSFQSIIAQDVEKSMRLINTFRSLPEKDSLPDARDLVLRIMQDHDDNDYFQKPYYHYNLYQKTFVNVIERKDTTYLHKKHAGKKMSFLSRYIIQPFDFILDYARPDNESDQENITVLLFEDYESFYGDSLKKKERTDTSCRAVQRYFTNDWVPKYIFFSR